MPRARNIKPSFFTNEDIGTSDPFVGLLFIGLWCLADKDGRLEDRPLRIKAELFPYREKLDCNGYLTVLERCRLIQRYEVGGEKYIQVVNFSRHQSPHNTEKSKGYPPPPNENAGKNDLTVRQPLRNGEITEPKRPDSLIPDSLNDDSLKEETLAETTLSPSVVPTWKKWKRHLEQIDAFLNPIAEEQQVMMLNRAAASDDDKIAIIEFSISRRAKNLITNGDHRGKPAKTTNNGKDLRI